MRTPKFEWWRLGTVAVLILEAWLLKNQVATFVAGFLCGIAILGSLMRYQQKRDAWRYEVLAAQRDVWRSKALAFLWRIR